jgi:hypothetical protein
MCRPTDSPPFTDREIAAIAAIDTEPDDSTICADCGADEEDPHAQHRPDCQIMAERYWLDVWVIQ